MASAPRVSGWIREKCLRGSTKIELHKIKRGFIAMFQGSGNLSLTKFNNHSSTQNELVSVITFPLSEVIAWGGVGVGQETPTSQL